MTRVRVALDGMMLGLISGMLLSLSVIVVWWFADLLIGVFGFSGLVSLSMLGLGLLFAGLALSDPGEVDDDDEEEGGGF